MLNVHERRKSSTNSLLMLTSAVCLAESLSNRKLTETHYDEKEAGFDARDGSNEIISSD